MIVRIIYSLFKFGLIQFNDSPFKSNWYNLCLKCCSIRQYHFYLIANCYNRKHSIRMIQLQASNRTWVDQNYWHGIECEMIERRDVNFFFSELLRMYFFFIFTVVYYYFFFSFVVWFFTILKINRKCLNKEEEIVAEREPRRRKRKKRIFNESW